LRDEHYSDAEALRQLLAAFRTTEASVQGEHISIPIRDPRLFLWLERKGSEQGLHPGETVNRTLFKVTVTGLFRLMDDADGFLAPASALQQIGDRHSGEDWYRALQAQLDIPSSWQAVHRQAGEFLGTGANLVTLIGTIAQLI